MLKKYVIEPNTPATADHSNAKLASFLESIGADKDIEQIVAMEMDEAPRLLVTTTDDGDGILPVTTWQDVEIEITLDSGCRGHVMDVAEAPGYLVGESPRQPSKT